MTVAIYIRTSTEQQNPENQLKDCLSINKYGEYEIYKDKQSAWKEYHERDAFKRLEADIKSRKVNVLFVWDLDRIYRNRINLIGFFAFCKMYHCKIFSCRQRWLESINNIQAPFNEIMHDLMLQIMGWLAEEESNKRSQRVKAAVRKRNNTTISYKGNKWGRKKLSTQKYNKIIELDKQGYSMRQIAKTLEVSLGVVHKKVHENNQRKTP